MSEQIDTAREYTTKEAAEISGVDQSWFRRLCIDGRLKARNIEGRVWLIDGASLAAWLAERDDKLSQDVVD